MEEHPASSPQIVAVLSQWRHTHALFLPADAAAYLGSASRQLVALLGPVPTSRLIK